MKRIFVHSELLTTAEAEIILDPGVSGTPAPQPPGWNHLGAAAVCFCRTFVAPGVCDARYRDNSATEALSFPPTPTLPHQGGRELQRQLCEQGAILPPTPTLPHQGGRELQRQLCDRGAILAGRSDADNLLAGPAGRRQGQGHAASGGVFFRCGQATERLHKLSGDSVRRRTKCEKGLSNRKRR